MALTPREKISRAKIRMYSRMPYFSYIVEHLTIIERATERTLAIDRYGNLYYNPSFILSLNDDELVFALAHEGEHLALKHHERGKGRTITLSAITEPDKYIFPNKTNSFITLKFIPSKNHMVVADDLTNTIYKEDVDYIIDYKTGIVSLTHNNVIPIGKELSFYSKIYFSLWNIAIDLVDNNILVNSGLIPPEKICVPKNDTYEFAGVTITDISKKSSEEIYEDLKKGLFDKQKEQQKKKKGNKSSGDGEKSDKEGEGEGEGEESEDGGSKSKGKQTGNLEVYVPKEESEGLDTHEFDKKESDVDKELQDSKGSEKGKSNPQPSTTEKDWDRINSTAYNYAKQRGKIPAGLGREFEIYNKNYINWYAILSRQIQRSMPQDFVWSKPNRKYISQKLYLPSVVGEHPVVLIAIDTSGSVDPHTLSIFMTGIISLARSFPGAEMRVITHDAKVHDDYLIKNGNVSKIMNIKIHGGGGTSHEVLYDYIKEKRYNKTNNLLFTFTDAMSIYPNKPCINTMFILAGYYDKRYVPKWNKGIIEIKS
jgi:predicted metal-dependent peptidase